MNALVRWWAILWSMIFIIGFLAAKNLFVALWYADKSKVSFVTIFLFTIISLFIGYLTNSILRKQKTEHIKFLPACWFASDAMMGLGMIGTLIGFMLMLGTTMDSIDFNDVMTIKKAVIDMAAGISVAIVTTLTGLVCSLLIKLQLVNLETDIDDEEAQQ